jgi:hypothetical protein
MSAYVSPTAGVITAAGASAPTYAQILAYLQTQYLAIFGVDAYLANDAQDFQLLAVFAQACSDSNSAFLAAYNSFSPATAQGVGLSSVVQINGLTRLAPSNSSAACVLSGTPNISIINGQAIDIAGNVWALPASVTIGASGTVNVVAVCTVQGAVTLAPNTLTINTPTYGWIGITNSGGIVGAPAETDAALRVRQEGSVALPSQTIFEGVVAAIENTAGIGRVRGYENNTNAAEAIGTSSLPAKTVCFVCEGGTPALIFNAIFLKLTPGVSMFADPAFPGNIQQQAITDSNGSTRTVSYMQAVETYISSIIAINPLNGWSAATIPLIQAAIGAYIYSLPIGANISFFNLIAAGMLMGTPQAGTFEVIGPCYISSNNGVSYVQTDIQTNYLAAPTTGTNAAYGVTVNVL